MPFELTSPDFADGEAIPEDLTCDGADLQPALRWAGAPAGTAEFALVMHDPDAGGFVHWVVAGIPADRTELGGELPQGAVAGRNDFGRTGYAGPCPPSGNHGYVFTLYALSAPLGLTGDVTAHAVRQAAQDRTLATAVLNGSYRRS
jgi:Raf kinase inhibitor-like YbhB/YbcL family protein